MRQGPAPPPSLFCSFPRENLRQTTGPLAPPVECIGSYGCFASMGDDNCLLKDSDLALLKVPPGRRCLKHLTKLYFRGRIRIVRTRRR